MSLNEELIDLQNTCQITDLKRASHGVANEVYFCKRNANNLVIKYYQKEPNFPLIERLLQLYHTYHIASLQVLEKYSIHDRTACIYPLIEGVHILDLNQEQIKQILNIIKLECQQRIDTYDEKDSIFVKYHIYEAYFRASSLKRVEADTINLILQIVDRISLKRIPCSIVHGDLSPYNIIWQKDNPVIIDLDECVIAPVYYEFIVFLIKYCFQNGTFYLEKASSIIKQYKHIFSRYDDTALKDTWYFYITKVLFEKLYYYDLGYIDLYDEIQIKDDYRWWLALLTDDNVVKTLFG